MSSLVVRIRKEIHDFHHSARISIAEVRHGIRRASWHDILLVMAGIIMSIVGAGGQIISMNQWLAHFPSPASNNFKPVGGPYVVLLSAGLSSLVLYLIVYAVWQFKYRSGFAWMRCKEVWFYCGIAGLLLSLNGFLATYATSHTAEVVQAMLIASQIVWTLLFALLFKINQGKNYCHILVISSLILSVSGIIVGTLATSAPPDSGNGDTPTDKAAWAALYALGIIPASLINVVAAKFFQTCTYDENELKTNTTSALNDGEDEQETTQGEKSSPFITPEERDNDENDSNNLLEGSSNNNKKLKFVSNLSVHKSEDTSNITNENDESGEAVNQNKNQLIRETKMVEIGHAKVLFLLLATVAQVICVLVLMPADFLKWFGPNAGDPAATISQLNSGLRCVFNTLDLYSSSSTSNGNTTTTTAAADELELGNSSKNSSFPFSPPPQQISSSSCASNLEYFIAFAICFALTNAGNVIVNQFSAPLSSIVAQIASPLTAIVLEAQPSLSPAPTQSNLGMASAGLVMIIVGSILFGFWEELTSERKYELNELVKSGVLSRISTSKTQLFEDGSPIRSSTEGDAESNSFDGNPNDDDDDSMNINGRPSTTIKMKKGPSNISVPPPSAVGDNLMALASADSSGNGVVVMDQPAGDHFGSIHPETFTPTNGGGSSSNKKKTVS